MDLKFPKAMYHTVHIYTPCSRLPLYQGPTATYVVPLLALMTLPQWNCPDDVSIANSTAQSSIVLEKIQKVWSFKLCLSDIFWNFVIFWLCIYKQTCNWWVVVNTEYVKYYTCNCKHTDWNTDTCSQFCGRKTTKCIWYINKQNCVQQQPNWCIVETNVLFFISIMYNYIDVCLGLKMFKYNEVWMRLCLLLEREYTLL